MNGYMPYTSAFIGATGEYPILDYINTACNVLDTKINTTAYNLDYKITSLAVDLWHVNPNNYFSLIRTKIYNSNIPHTYIINSNMNGEIRFSTAAAFSSTNDVVNDYSVKIDTLGKLYVYHKFNLLQPTFPQGFYDVEGEIFAIKNQALFFDSSIVGLGIYETQSKQQILLLQQLTITLQLEVNNLQQEINMLGVVSQNDMYLLQGSETFNNLLQEATNIVQNMNANYSRSLQVAATVGITGGASLIMASMADYLNREYYTRLISNFSNCNIPSLTQDQKNILYSCNATAYNSNTSNFTYFSCNLNIYSGFINSNITTPQFIPFLKTNQLSISNIDISNIFVNSNSLSNLNIYSGFINSNITTSQLIPSITTCNIYMLNGGNINGVGTAYVNVCAANSVSTTLNTNVGFPTSNAFGGIGDKILLRNGSTTTCPISIGIDSNYSLWNSITSNNSSTAFDWYIDGIKKMSIYKDKLDTSNLLIFQNGISIPSITQTTILNETPNVYKKYAFNFSCSTAIIISGTTYYKYDIDLRNYTKTKPSANPLSPYRIFNIRLFLSSVYFEAMTNNTYNILNYEVYMSNEINAGSHGGAIGINIFANHIGNTPPNPILVNILPSYFTLLRTADFNYLSVISTFQDANLNCIIQDIIY